MAPTNELHVVYGSGPVGTAVVEILLAQGRPVRVVTLREFVRILGEEANPAPKLSALPRPVIRALLPLLGIAVPALRGLTENLYIGYEPYIVDHSAYKAAFSDHATPLHEAIRTTVQWYQAHTALKGQAAVASVPANK